MKTNIYYLVMLMVVIFSCQNDLTTQADVAVPQDVVLASSYEVLYDTPNVYNQYFSKSDVSVGYSALKPGPLHAYTFSSKSSLQEGINTPLAVAIQDKGKVAFGVKTRSLLSEKDIYGSDVTFTIKGSKAAANANGQSTFSTNTSGTDVSLYVPELVEITSPAVKTDRDQFPACYYDNFVLTWNPDDKNENGLMIFAEYFGDNAIPKNIENVHITNIDYIADDNGRAILNTKLFDGMPNLAIVHLILLRGNIAIEEVDGELYKLFAESHVRLPIVIVKDTEALRRVKNE